MVDVSSLNPFGNISIGGASLWGSIGIIILIALLILGCIGYLVFRSVVNKQYWINIEVHRLIGGTPMRVGVYRAKEVPMGMAGDKLWRVAPNGFTMPFKIVKWLPVGKIQSAPRMWKYWLREDGEWINYADANLDELSKRMGAKFVSEDMRLQRLATDRLLEQRLMDKSFWDRWKDTIMTVIFFLVITVCMIIIFYQFGKFLDHAQLLIDKITEGLEMVQGTCQPISKGGTQGLIPA